MLFSLLTPCQRSIMATITATPTYCDQHNCYVQNCNKDGYIGVMTRLRDRVDNNWKTNHKCVSVCCGVNLGIRAVLDGVGTGTIFTVCCLMGILQYNKCGDANTCCDIGMKSCYDTRKVDHVQKAIVVQPVEGSSTV